MCDEVPAVYIIDDDAGVLDALVMIVHTVGISSKTYLRAEDFLAEFRGDQPCCIILDVRMPGMSGTELQEELIRRKIEIPIIAISGLSDIQTAVKMVKAGALDFFEKPIKEQLLLDAIHSALKQDKERRLLEKKCVVCQERYDSLTPREKEVMALMVRGKTGKEIAAELNISSKTVEKFRAKVMKKTKVHSIAELVLIAVNLKLLSPQDYLEIC